jgi:hypothetical protein
MYGQKGEASRDPFTRKAKHKHPLKELFRKKVKPTSGKDFKSAFNTKSEQKQYSDLGSYFSKAISLNKGEEMLPDFFGKALGKRPERAALPSSFSKEVEKDRRRSIQADFFTGSIRKTTRGEQLDHFAVEVRKSGKRGFQADHFNAKSKDRAPSEKDLEVKARRKLIYPKNFVGERFRLINRDPNANKRKTQKKIKRKERDPFSRARNGQTPTQTPRGEMDLFQGGVLPKMKDLR